MPMRRSCPSRSPWPQHQPMAMGPYQRGVQHLRVLWPNGPAVERVEFQLGLPDLEMAVPRELMQAWGLSEGSLVNVRPAP